jgi:hypothetical protein
MAAKKPKTKRKPKASSKAAAPRAKRKSQVKATPVIDEIESIEAVGDEVDPLAPPEHPDRGRPTKYRDAYARIAETMCRLGATDYDLAQAFDVTTFTIWKWQTQHENFSNALKVRKGEFDDRIERSLAQRAAGYTFDTEKVFNYQGTIVRAKTTEHVPPDPGAAKLWLTNRRREEWADTAKHEVTGPGGKDLIPEKTLPPFELARYLAYALEQYAERGQPDGSDRLNATLMAAHSPSPSVPTAAPRDPMTNYADEVAANGTSQAGGVVRI